MMTDKTKQAFLIMGAVVLITRLIALYLFHTFDDAFITYRYGCNLAMGRGFIYNVGESVLGTTAPIHGLLNALFCSLSLPITAINGVFNSLLDVGTLVLVGLAWRNRETQMWFVYLFGALWAGVPSFGRITAGGMETSLFLFVMALAIWLYTQDRFRIAVFVAAFAYFLRPEAVILVGILGLYELIRGRFTNAVQMGLITFMTMGFPLILIRGYYGTFLSQSVISKQNLPPRPLSDVLNRFFGEDPTVIILAVLGCVGMIWVLRGRDNRQGRIIASWTVLYFASYLIRRPLVWPWYGGPLYFGFAILMAGLLVSLVTRFKNGALRHSIRLGAIVAPLLLWGAIVVLQGRSDIRETVYQPLETWCDQGFADDARIIADDIGAIGFYCINSHITDTAGLVTPGVQIYRDAARLVTEGDAHYIFFTFSKNKQSLMNQDGIRERYRPIKLFSHRNQTDLNNLNYPDVIWTQEYVLFESVANR